MHNRIKALRDKRNQPKGLQNPNTKFSMFKASTLLNVIPLSERVKAKQSNMKIVMDRSEVEQERRIRKKRIETELNTIN
jgi:hypothetical protein